MLETKAAGGAVSDRWYLLVFADPPTVGVRVFTTRRHGMTSVRAWTQDACDMVACTHTSIGRGNGSGRQKRCTGGLSYNATTRPPRSHAACGNMAIRVCSLAIWNGQPRSSTTHACHLELQTVNMEKAACLLTWKPGDWKQPRARLEWPSVHFVDGRFIWHWRKSV